MAKAWRVTRVAALVALLPCGFSAARAQDLKVGEIYRGSVQLTKGSL